MHLFPPQFNNVRCVADQLQPVTIPDVVPTALFPDANFSMVAGEFVEVYGAQVAAWDVVCACFFLDTANNVLAYLRTISQLLKPGGVLLNLGPLLYHYGDMAHEVSIELSYEELKATLPHFGLRLVVCSFS